MKTIEMVKAAAVKAENMIQGLLENCDNGTDRWTLKCALDAVWYPADDFEDGEIDAETALARIDLVLHQALDRIGYTEPVENETESVENETADRETLVESISAARAAIISGGDINAAAENLLLLAGALESDADRNAAYMAAQAVLDILDAPAWVDSKKQADRAVDILYSLLEKAAVEKAEAVLDGIAAEPIETVEFESIDEPADGAGESEWAEAVAGDYRRARETVENAIYRYENEVWECEYGNRKNEVDGWELARKKGDLETAQDALESLDEILESFSAGEMDGWTAENKINRIENWV